MKKYRIIKFFGRYIENPSLIKNIIFKLFFVLFCAIIFLPHFSNNAIVKNTILLGLDPGWHLALQYAHQQSLTFGEDIIFTYGPLGYLTKNESLIVPNINLTIFGVLQLIYLLIGINLVFEKYKKSNPIVWLLILFIIPIVNISLSDSILLLNFFSFVFLLHSLQTLNPKYLIISYIGALICFYIKIETGFPLLLALLASIVLFCYKSKQKYLNLKLIAFFIITFVFSLLVLNVNIVGYAVGGFYMIKGYNEAMFVFLDGNDAFAFIRLIGAYLLFLFTVAFLLMYIVCKKKVSFSIVLQIAILTGLSFIFYKKGITRISLGNMQYALRGVALVALLFSMFIVNNSWFKYIFIAQFFAFSFSIPHKENIKNVQKIFNSNKKQITNIKNKFKYKKYLNRDSILISFSNIENNIGIDSLSNINFDNADKEDPDFQFLYNVEKVVKRSPRIHRFYKSFDENRHLVQRIYLPNNIRKKLENKTVDIYHTNIHYVYYNNLNYKPRPLLQSYSAYNKFLDEKNVPSITVNNKESVDYILWDCFPGMDKRYKFWQCPISLKNILENYEYDELVYPKNIEWKLLLKKREQAKKIFRNEIYKSDSFYLNKLYNIPKEQNDLLTANIKVNETIFHKVTKVFAQTKALQFEIHLEDGSVITRHKTIRNILNNGIIINKYINENNQHYETSLFKHNFSSLKNIKAIKIIGNPIYFENKIDIKIYN